MVAKLVTVDFLGETFAVSDEMNPWVLSEFAVAVDEGLETSSFKGLAALARFITECIAVEDVRGPERDVDGEKVPGDVLAQGRERFVRLARSGKPSEDDLMGVVYQMFGMETGRPTGRSSDSSDGPPVTLQKSVSSADVSAELYPGRPDLQLIVRAAQAAQRSA